MLSAIIQHLAALWQSVSFVSVVMEFEQAAIFRLGELRAVRRTPGLLWSWPLVERVVLRPTVPEVVRTPPQCLVTRDGRSVQVGVSLTYEIEDLGQWWTGVQDFDRSLIDLAHAHVGRAVLGQTWDEIRTSPGVFNDGLTSALAAEVEQWGVRLHSARLTTIAPVRALSIMQTSAE